MALVAGGAPAVPAPAQDGPFEIALWANDDSVERLPNLVATSSHPCGAIAVVRLHAMPPLQAPEGALAPELVAEIDADGTTLRRWSVPVDYQPLALRGEALLISHGEQHLWIGTDGGIARGDPGQPPDDIQALVCPARAPLADSEYRQCAFLHDRETGEARRIVFESSCT